MNRYGTESESWESEILASGNRKEKWLPGEKADVEREKRIKMKQKEKPRTVAVSRKKQKKGIKWIDGGRKNDGKHALKADQQLHIAREIRRQK